MWNIRGSPLLGDVRSNKQLSWPKIHFAEKWGSSEYGGVKSSALWSSYWSSKSRVYLWKKWKWFWIPTLPYKLWTAQKKLIFLFIRNFLTCFLSLRRLFAPSHRDNIGLSLTINIACHLQAFNRDNFLFLSWTGQIFICMTVSREKEPMLIWQL